MYRQDIKRLENIVELYLKICANFDKIEDSLYGCNEMFNSDISMRDLIREFGATARYEMRQLNDKLNAIKRMQE